MKRNHPGESKTSKRRVSAVERHREALELRKQGYSYPEIAAKMHYSLAGAYKAVMTALKEITREPAEELLRMEVARLDQMLKAMAPMAKYGNIDAINMSLKVAERRAKLLGLDAPIKREETITVTINDLAKKAAEDAGLDPNAVIAQAEALLKEANVK